MKKLKFWLICLMVVIMSMQMTSITTYTTEILSFQTRSEKRSKKTDTVFYHLILQNRIKSVLTKYGLPYDSNVIQLLLGTAAHESHLGKWMKQINGPALGLFQMEPNTIKDIQENYLKYRPQLRRQLLDVSNILDTSDFISNIDHQIVYARLHYLRVSSSVPVSLWGQAVYWKTYWNSYKGKGTVKRYVEDYRRLVK